MDSTPIYKTISTKDVIARAKVQLRLTSPEHDDYFRIMLFEALDSLNALSQTIKKSCKITFTDNVAQLPDDLIKFLALRINNAVSNIENDPIASQIFSQCQFAVYADVPFMNGCGCDISGFGSNITSYSNSFQINNGFVYFNFSSNLVAVHDATVAYLALNVDEDGNSQIYQRYERPVAAYLCYRFTQAYFEKFNQYIIESYQSEWAYQKVKIVGQDYVRDFQQNKFEIGQMMRALLVSPKIQIFNP